MANIAGHLYIGPNVNGQQNLTGFVEFLAVSGWIADDILVINVVEKYF